MNALTTVALIQSAKFEYSEIEIDGNTLLVGSNGAGKTTILRSILYFYTANSRALGINSAKKQNFIDFYFPYTNSYIAYVYKKDGKYILVVVYKMSSLYVKMCMFASKPNLEEVFVHNQELLEPQGVWLRAKELGAVVSKAFSPSEYLKTLYGRSTSREFSLFLARDYNGFVKTLTNIFVNSKVDSDTIKKVLTSSLEREDSIDLQRIKRHLDNFNTMYEDIQKYQKSKPTIQKIIAKLDELDDTTKEMKRYLSAVAFAKESTHLKAQELQKEITTTKQTLQIQQEQLAKARGLYEQRSSKLTEKIGVAKAKLKEIERLESDYKEQDIQTKLQEYKQLDMLESTLKQLQHKKEFVTKKVEEIDKAHQNQLSQIDNAFQRDKNTLSKKLLEEQNRLKDKEYKLKEQQQNELQKLQEELSCAKEEIQQKRLGFELKLKDITNDINNEKTKAFVFVDENKFAKLQLEIVSIEKDKQTTLSSLALSSEKLESLQKEYDAKHISLKDRYEKQRQELQDSLEKLKLQQSPKENSLLREIYEQGLDASKYLYFLKDEILQEGFDIEFVSHSNAIFEVGFHQLQIPSSDISHHIEMITQKIQKLSKKFDQEQKALQVAFEKGEKQLIKEKKQFNDSIKTLEKELIESQTELKRLQIYKDEQKSAFDREKAKKVAELEDIKKQILQEIETFDSAIQTLQSETNSKKSSIKIFYTKELKKLQATAKELQDRYKQDIAKLEQLKASQNKEQETNYYTLLKQEQIDISQLQEYEKKIANLTAKIEKIRSYEKLIFGYERDLAQIESKPAYKKELKELQATLHKLKEAFLEEERLLGSKIETISKQSSKLEGEFLEIQKELERFEEFEGSSIFLDAKHRVDVAPSQEFIPLEKIKEQIILLNDRYGKIQSSIITQVNSISYIFDNRLEIKRSLDPIVSAKHLREFYDYDKIQKFQEWLETNLNQIVQHLIQEYQKLITQTSKVQKLISKINKLFDEIQIGVIDELELRYSKTNNKSLEILEQIQLLDSENIGGFGLSLFGAGGDSQKMIKLLRALVLEIEDSGYETISLEDSFVLEFRVVENGNDSKYQVSLDNIGSNGTDVLVKSMIYIAMVHIFKSQITKEQLKVHVVLDEIGILSQKYLKALIEFANKYGIIFVNGAPDEKLIGTYKRVYLIKREHTIAKSVEIISR